jgi:hypothetical protein
MKDRRLAVDVRSEDVERLEQRAFRNIRPMRDEAAWLLHWALEEIERREADEPVARAS